MNLKIYSPVAERISAGLRSQFMWVRVPPGLPIFITPKNRFHRQKPTNNRLKWFKSTFLFSNFVMKYLVWVKG